MLPSARLTLQMGQVMLSCQAERSEVSSSHSAMKLSADAELCHKRSKFLQVHLLRLVRPHAITALLKKNKKKNVSDLSFMNLRGPQISPQASY